MRYNQKFEDSRKYVDETSSKENMVVGIQKLEEELQQQIIKSNIYQQKIELETEMEVF